MPITYKRDLVDVDWVAIKAAVNADDFDNGRTPDQLHRSFANSAVTTIAYDGDRIIATARALSDGVCNAYVVDLWTQSDYRRQGIASTMMRQLIADMPGQHVYLFTDDAIPFYESLGFQRQGEGMFVVSGEWLDNRPAPDPT